MASYTRLIEFKVKDTELNRAVNKLSKTLDRIDKSLVGIDKKLDQIAKQGFGGIAKEAIKAEKSVGKLAKSVKSMSGPQGFTRMLTGAALGGIIGKKGDIADAVVRLGALDAAIRVLTKGNAGLPALNRRLIEATTALGGFTLAHTGAIAAVVGGSAAILTGTKFFYELGKGVRQAEANMIDFIKTSRQLGAGAGFRSLFPKGSLWGGDKRDTTPSFDGKKAAAAVDKELGRTFTGQRSPVTGYGAIGSLDTKRKALAQTQQIQEKLVALTGKHLQASVQVRNAQVRYNIELGKTKLVQAAVTVDLWAMQKAWQGIVSTMKGAGNLIGGLFGGKFGGAGKGLGVITLSRSIEFLTGKLGFLNKAWIDNTNKIALWSARASEAITAVNIAYTGFSKVLGAAQWTTGAIAGFIRWEEQAMLSIRRINTARNNLDKRMAGLLDKGQNPLTGIGKWLRGESGERGVKAQLADKGESNQQRIAREIEVQQRLLKATNTTSKDYLQIQRQIIKLQKQQTIEVNKRRMMEVRAGKDIKEVYKDEIQAVEDRRSAKEASIRKERAKRAKFNKQVLQSELKEIANKKKAELDAIEKVRQAEIRAARDAANAQRRKAQQRKAAMGRFGENLMLGAGFPMLFGGGVGAVAGGVTGAVTQSAMGSKGFGAQILFSAVGQQIDAFAGKAMELGKALKDPTEALSMLSTMGIKVEESFSNHIKALVDLGRTHEAQALVNKEVAKIIGEDGVKALKDLGVANAELMDKANKLRIKIMSDLAPAFEALIGMASRFVDSVGGNNIRQRAKDLDIKAYQSAHNRIEKEIVKEFGFWATDESKAEYWRRMTEASKGIIRDKQPGWLGETANSPSNPPSKSGGIGSGTTQSGAVWEHTVAKSLDPLNQKRQELERILELGTQEAGIQQEIAEIVKAQGLTIGTISADKLKDIEKEVRKVSLLRDQVDVATQLENIYNQMGQTIGDGLTTAIQGAIQGTKTLGEVATSVLNSIANMLIQYGMTSLFGGMGGFGKWLSGTRAEGGPVTGNKSYIVGEKGPELFTPKSSGHITPNDELGRGGTSNITVNVDASGSSVEGDADQSAALGKMLGAAIQAELIKQRRPGGLLR